MSEFDQAAAAVQGNLVDYQQQQDDAQEKMAALQLYVQKYGARIDIHHKNRTTPQAEAPNLGTSVPSWYYHDGRGNKIFVQDMNFDNQLALSKGGSGMSVRNAHGHEFSETVVVVPRAKRNPAWHAEYLRRCEEYEAARKRLGSQSGRVAIPDGHRLIGDGLPTGHTQAYGRIGMRKQGGGGAGMRSSQARILGGSSARGTATRPHTAGAITYHQVPSSGGGGGCGGYYYQQPQFMPGTSTVTSNSDGVLAAVMVNDNNSAACGAGGVPQQQQQQLTDGSSSGGGAMAVDASSAALQEEAQRLLAQLGQVQQQQQQQQQQTAAAAQTAATSA